MKATVKSYLRVLTKKIKTSEDIANLVSKRGREKVCEFCKYTKCLQIETDLQTETGIIKWLSEDGTLISEKGYHYDINCFI